MAASLLTMAGYAQQSIINATLGVGLFSVSDGHQVRFATGNLEYDSTYRFAANQYDYGGYFGWGTGNNPTNTATDWHYYPATYDDWGSHVGTGWRTLTKKEWYYILGKRAGAAAKRGAATVCGVHGLVLLPDNWEGDSFNKGFDDGWSTNEYDTASWAAMEAAGAVFLPAAGYRYGKEMNKVGERGYYWSPTRFGEHVAYGLYLSKYGGGYSYGSRSNGLCVRLVKDEPTTPQKIEQLCEPTTSQKPERIREPTTPKKLEKLERL